MTTGQRGMLAAPTPQILGRAAKRGERPGPILQEQESKSRYPVVNAEVPISIYLSPSQEQSPAAIAAPWRRQLPGRRAAPGAGVRGPGAGGRGAGGPASASQLYTSLGG